jgi:uncharacterized damage-inducible protein DinB
MTTMLDAIVEQLRLSAEGPAWHGPSVREAVDGSTAAAAFAHPIGGAHSIWELVNHIRASHGLVLRRLDGIGGQMTPAEDWPAPAAPTDEAWREDVAAYFAVARQLREAIATFPLERLHQPLVSDPPYPAFTQFVGLTQHDLYHAGQIVLLRRALGDRRPLTSPS